MKRKILWCWLSLLLVAALVLASCGPKEEVVKEGPQYGGTLTFWSWASNDDAPSPDIADGYWASTQYLTPIQERPIMGDFEKYGPRGTGEYEFQPIAYQPEGFMKGTWLESWKASPEKIVWNIRPGIMWQSVEGVMEAREVTADDVVADLLYFRDAPGGRMFKVGFSGEIYATDRYTVVIEFSRYDIGWIFVLGYEDRALLSPPETEGNDKWEDQVGTGPFMFKEYVVGSHMSYKRNPNYWDKTTINGVEYDIPFLDEMIRIIIPDEATQIAALRTGKLDFHHRVPPTLWPDLENTAPELLSSKAPSGGGVALAFKTTEPPFDSKEVRRAMMVGTDLKAFADLHGVGPLPKHWWPLFPGDPSVYTPLEKLPAEIRLLYDYNPDKAKQMLADAGYPDGFKTSVYTNTELAYLDRAALLEYQWDKIGVEVEIKAFDAVTIRELIDHQNYSGTVLTGPSVADPTYVITRHMLTGGIHNHGQWSHEPFDKLVNEATAAVDINKRIRLIKEAALISLDEVPYIPTDFLPEGHFWWPWVKNYYGERNVGDTEIAIVLAYAWIDQNLKAEMGY